MGDVRAVPSGPQRVRDQAEKVRDAESRRPLEAGETEQRKSREDPSGPRARSRPAPECRSAVPPSAGRTCSSDAQRAVPPRFGHVQVLGAVPGDHLRQPGPPQEFGVLLPDPGAMLPCASLSQSQSAPPRFRLLVCPSSRTALAGQCAEQEVQRRGTGVGPRCVAVPGHLHQVALGLRKDSREDFGERAGLLGPARASPRWLACLRRAAGTQSLARPHLGRRVVNLVVARRDPRRLAGAFLLPEAEQALFEPGEDRRVSSGRVEQVASPRLGVRSLVVGEHRPRHSRRVRLPTDTAAAGASRAARAGSAPGSRAGTAVRVARNRPRPASRRSAPRAGASGGRSRPRRGVALPVGDEQKPGLLRSKALLLDCDAGPGRRNNRRAAGGWGRRRRDESRPRRVGGALRPSSSPSIARCQIFSSNATGSTKSSEAPSAISSIITRPSSMPPPSRAMATGARRARRAGPTRDARAANVLEARRLLPLPRPGGLRRARGRSRG